MGPIIILHGGAGDIPDSRVIQKVSSFAFLTQTKQNLTIALLPPQFDGIKKAALAGYKILLEQRSENDEKPSVASRAVIEAVRIMEDHEAFNAGFGSVLNEDGEVEMDAVIMDGKDLQSGAVAGIGTCQDSNLPHYATS